MPPGADTIVIQENTTREGDTVLVDDGRIKLHVVATSPTDVTFQVVEGGTLKEHKGINLPGVAISAPAGRRSAVADRR